MLKKYLRYVIPSICSMVIFNLYTLVDGIFVAHYEGDTALAAINVASPFVTTIFSVGVLFAVGSSTIMAIYRGAKEEEKMHEVFTMNTLVISCIALFISLVSFFHSHTITKILQANKDVFGYANSYIQVLSCFAFFYIVSYCFEVLLKADGFPHKSIIGICIGACTNLVLDPLFMGPFQMGIEGAALATGLSQMMTFLFFFYHFAFSHKSHFHFVRAKYPFRKYKRIIPLGLADCISEISPGIMITAFNFRINQLLGTNGLVTFTVLMYVYNLVLMVMVGTSQGTQPLISYAYGKDDKKAIQAFHRYARVLVSIAGIALFGFVQVFAANITGAFIQANTTNYMTTIHALRLFSPVFLIMGHVVITTGYMVSIEQAKKAFILSISRGIVFVILSLLICTSLFQANGIWISCTISEILCLVLAIYDIKKVHVKYKL